ncbi:MAG: 2-hydroxymuconate tautomerase family protein [Pseudomonadota bacterium]
MPTIETFITEGHSDGRKQQLIESLTQAVVTSVDAPADSVRIILTEVPDGNFGVGGKAAELNPQAVLQAFLIAGRTDAQKVELIAALTDAAVTGLEARREDVRVIIKDVPNTDFGLGGKTAAALGRGIGRAAMRGPV